MAGVSVTSIPGIDSRESILLSIFARELEDLIQKSKIRFRIAHDSFDEIVQNLLRI